MIQLARPELGDEELRHLTESISSGQVLQGEKIQEFESLFSSYTSSQFSVAVSSGTGALMIALQSLGVGLGDAVITTSHSFIATSSAIRLLGAEPIFVDIEEEGYNLCPEGVRTFLESCDREDEKIFLNRDDLEALPESSPLRKVVKPGEVKAILCVHQYGIPCDLHAFHSLARNFNLALIEDAACALGSEVLWDGSWRKIGSGLSDAACFSFHPRKILTTGDGGMVNCSSANMNEELRLRRNHGMSAGVEGHRLAGFNFRLTDLQGGIGSAQMGRLESLLTRRQQKVALYRNFLESINDIAWPDHPDEKMNWQSLALRVPPSLRDQLFDALMSNEIQCKKGIPNAHLQPPYRSKISLPESERRSEETLILPLHHELSESDIEMICSPIRSLAG